MRREGEAYESEFPDVRYPLPPVAELVDDAFRAIAGGGGGQVEVMIRVQRDLQLLAAADNGSLRGAALAFSKEALERARLTVADEQEGEDIAAVAKHVGDVATEYRESAGRAD